jgi:hypothetical protein
MGSLNIEIRSNEHSYNLHPETPILLGLPVPKEPINGSERVNASLCYSQPVTIVWLNEGLIFTEKYVPFGDPSPQNVMSRP